mgnify:CR=1 FL=1
MNIILIFLFPNFLVFAEDRVDQLTREVIELRHEVEILNEKY